MIIGLRKGFEKFVRQFDGEVLTDIINYSIDLFDKQIASEVEDFEQKLQQIVTIVNYYEIEKYSFNIQEYFLEKIFEKRFREPFTKEEAIITQLIQLLGLKPFKYLD